MARSYAAAARASGITKRYRERAYLGFCGLCGSVDMGAVPSVASWRRFESDARVVVLEAATGV